LVQQPLQPLVGQGCLLLLLTSLLLLAVAVVVKQVLVETEVLVGVALVDIEREPHHLTQLNLMLLL
jgi:hypothetical protein